MTPRLAGLRADDVVASHRAADGAAPSIEPGRTYAHGTTMGAVAAVSCVWSTLTPHSECRSNGLARCHFTRAIGKTSQQAPMILYAKFYAAALLRERVGAEVKARCRFFFAIE